MRLRAALLVSTLLTFAPVLASAAGTDTAVATAVQREQAQNLFAKGKKNYDGGKYADALSDFKASIEIVQSPNTRLYVARTLREMGRLVEAYADFGRTLAEAKEHEHEDGRYGKAAQAAEAERAELGKRLGFVRLAIRGASDDAKLVVGGIEIVKAGWIEPIPVMPGNVEIALTSSGKAPLTKSATVAAGGTVDVSLEIDGTTPPPPPPPSVVDEKPSMPIWRPAWIAGYGVGVVGLGMFAIAGAMSNGTYSDVKAACGTGPCPASQADLVARGQREQTVANVGLAFGIIGVVAGTVFLILDLTSKGPAVTTAPPPSATPSASLRLGFDGVSFHTTF